jgi:hypothetical protein
MKTFASTFSTLVALASLAACHRAPDIAFGQYGPGYADKPDFAEVEFRHPLSVDNLQQLTPDNLKRFDQEQIDQIYARLTAGPIPDGPFDGDLVFPKGQSGDRRLAEIVGGLPARVVEWKAINSSSWARAVERQGLLPRPAPAAEPHRGHTPVAAARRQRHGQHPEDARRQRRTMAVVPGQVVLRPEPARRTPRVDHHRLRLHRHVAGYREKPDFLAGRNGLQVRDEIRMVRPGFYLGRAYIGASSCSTFTLYNKAIAERDGPAFEKTGVVAEDCWPGTQQRVVAALR